MMLLLDTCALLWLALEPAKLSVSAKAALSAPGAELLVSAISALEIAIKHSKGKLTLPQPPTSWFPEVVT